MKQLGITIMLLLFFNFNSYSQNSFLKTYDFGTEENSYQIQYYNNRIFVNTATYCGVECSYLSEIDTLGNILWRTEVPDIDIASGTMVIANDTITVTGNNAPLNTAFRMAHFTLDGEMLGETIEIEHPERKFIHMFQLTTQYFNNRYAICGSGWAGDTIWSLMYIVDKQGNIDTLITLDPADRLSIGWDSYIDSQGRLTTYHRVDYDDLPINYRKIYKFDTNYDTVWTYRSENTEYNVVNPRGCELHDGRTILSYTNPEQIQNIHSVRVIRPDGIRDWQYNWGVTPYRRRYILRLKTLSNGDIMGSGLYSENLQGIKSSPWLFRMTSKGELLWTRTYFDIDTNDNESRRGSLFDFIEIESGDILAVGYFVNENDDMLVMRVDSNGCLDPDDCNEVNILTGTNDLRPELQRIFIYPNPTRDILNIEFETNAYELDIVVTDIMGRTVINDKLIGGIGQINTQFIPAGIYIINLKIDGRIIAIEKFIKVGE